MDTGVFRHQHRRGPSAAGTAVFLLVLWMAGPTALWAGAAAAPDANNPPTIELTSVPPYGTGELLRGRVTGVDPAGYLVAAYIFVPPNGWWTKPTIAAPRTSIQPDGTWECNVATAPTDVYATRIMAFLIPAA